MMQKPGDRRLSDRDLFLPESVFEFGQRDVRLLSYQLPHQILIRRQREIFVAAEFGRLDAARLPVKLEEANDRADADAPLLRSFRDGGPALDRPNHSPTQILRIRLRHACWPPPSRHLESCSRPHGNPRVSLLGKRSSGHGLLSVGLQTIEFWAPRRGSAISSLNQFAFAGPKLRGADDSCGGLPLLRGRLPNILAPSGLVGMAPPFSVIR